MLTRLKAEPQSFPKLDLVYSPAQPITEPVVLTLPSNGVRLRFDGPEQRLRLIEIVDFTKNHVSFKDRDLVRPASASPVPGESSSGPTFRHIYNRLLGPTYGGEYIVPTDGSGIGVYVLSYPGVAFTFPLGEASYSPEKDVVALLSAPASQVATSMAVFSGDSWAQTRESLWTAVLPSIKTFAPLSKGKDLCPDEISLIKIHGARRLQLFQNWSSSASIRIALGETTPQDLVTVLGPPDAIYRKSDQRMYIHKMRTANSTRKRPNGSEFPLDKLTDTDQSSAPTTDKSNDDEAIEDEFLGSVSGECFFNYFYLGFNILVSSPVPPSQMPPSQRQCSADGELRAEVSSDRLVATKFVIHNNVPGSYPFNRHRRCRWEITYLPSQGPSQAPLTSESMFAEIQGRLCREWASAYGSEAEAAKQQRGMVLNRGWGDSPGSSCELIGGWEGGGGGRSTLGSSASKRAGGSEDSTTTLYGFPGLVFEVLRNDFVSALTVF